MAKKIYRTRKIYAVDCINSSGFCYCTHTHCTWEDVKSLKKTARMLGETIQYVCTNIIKDDYSY